MDKLAFGVDIRNLVPILLDYTRRAGGPKDRVWFWTPETAFMTPETFKIRIQNLAFSENENFYLIHK